MGFTVEDKHFIKWLSVSEQREARCLINMFPDRGWNLGGPKTLTGENHSSCTDDPRPRHARLHIAYSVANINKVTALTLILLKLSLSH